MDTTIGKFLAALRKERGLTQQEVGERLNVSNRTVSAWECGTVMPDILLLPALADLYGVTTDEILSGHKKEKEAPMPAAESAGSPQDGALAKFTLWISILAALFAVGYSMFFAGWYLDVQFLRTSRALCLSLLSVGAIVSFLSFATAVALWRSAEAGVFSKGGISPSFRTALRKRQALFAFFAATMSAAFAIVTACLAAVLLSQSARIFGDLPVWLWEMSDGQRMTGFGRMAAVFFALAAGTFLFGLLVWKKRKKNKA